MFEIECPENIPAKICERINEIIHRLSSILENYIKLEEHLKFRIRVGKKEKVVILTLKSLEEPLIFPITWDLEQDDIENLRNIVSNVIKSYLKFVRGLGFLPKWVMEGIAQALTYYVLLEFYPDAKGDIEKRYFPEKMPSLESIIAWRDTRAEKIVASLAQIRGNVTDIIAKIKQAAEKLSENETDQTLRAGIMKLFVNLCDKETLPKLIDRIAEEKPQNYEMINKLLKETCGCSVEEAYKLCLGK